MTPALFHKTDVKRMTSEELHETCAGFVDFASTCVVRSTRSAAASLQNAFEWWARREAARCRDELEWRAAQKRERA